MSLKWQSSKDLVATYDQQLCHVVDYLRQIDQGEIGGIINFIKGVCDPPPEADLDEEIRFKLSVVGAVANLGLMLAVQKVRGVGEFADPGVE